MATIRAVILLVDNRDSFTFNLVQAFRELGEDVVVRSSRGLRADEVRALAPDRIVIGPGPGRPEGVPECQRLLRALAARVPTLGVCLGHQLLASVLGARLARSVRLIHGSPVRVEHGGTGLFRGLPSPLQQTRYNSLTVVEESLPACLEVTARDDAGEVMGIAHTTWPADGVQFHPESIRSEQGLGLLANFIAGRPDPSSAATDHPAAAAALRPESRARGA